MLKKRFLILCLILSIFLLSLSCVSAFENETIDVNGIDAGGDILEEDDGNSFSDLQNEINNGSDEIFLNKDYTYNSSSDSVYRYGVTVDKAITINGNGHTLNGNNQARVFKVYSSGVVFKNIVFINGYCEYDIGADENSYGGVITRFSGSFNVMNCTFINNTAWDDGGAIYKANKVIDCTFINNVAGYGGAIESANTVTNCMFINNSASDTHGGAIYDAKTITNCTFINNNAKHYMGGAVYMFKNIIDCTFINNYASEGGAVYRYNYAPGDIVNSRFINNTAKKGGAVYSYNSQGDIINCSFMNNVAEYGGAVYSDDSNHGDIINSSFVNNSADEGGAIHGRVQGNINRIVNCSFINNTPDNIDAEHMFVSYLNVNLDPEIIFADDELTIDVYTAEGASGTVSITVDGMEYTLDLVDYHAQLKQTNLTLGFHKVTVVYSGNEIFKNDTFEASFNVMANEGLYITADDISYGNDLIINVHIGENDIYGGENSTGFIKIFLDEIEYNLTINNTHHGQLTIQDVEIGQHNVTATYNNLVTTTTVNVMDTFTNLELLINNNDEIFLDRDYMYNPQTDLAYINGITLNKTITINGNGHKLNGNNLARIFRANVNRVSIILNNIEFINGFNSALLIEGTSYYLFTIVNCSFINNNGENGGALDINECYTNIINCSFINNSAKKDGGAIHCYLYRSGRPITIENCDFISNCADGNGGAIKNYYEYSASQVFVNNCSFIDNAAEGNGGAIYDSKNQNIIVSTNVICSSFMDNAANDGGAIYDITNVINSTFTNNAPNNSNLEHMAESYLNVNLNPQIIFADDVLTIDVCTATGADGNVSVTIDETEYVLDLVDYHAQLNVSGLSVGSHKVTTAYSGNDIYINSTVESVIYVNNNENLIIINDDIVRVGDDVVIDVYVGANKTGLVTVTFGGNEYLIELMNNHHAQLTIQNVEIGEYDINAEYMDLFNSSNVIVMDRFNNLQELIDNAESNGTINLEHDYYFDNNGTITINKAITINGNGFTLNGGNRVAIFVIESYGVILNNITFINGYSEEYGGAVYCNFRAGVEIFDCLFVNNTANNDGGAVCRSDNIINCVFINNTAYDKGGAVSCAGNSLINGGVRNCVFINNTAEKGGSIDSSGNVENCIFINNSANEGAAIIDSDPISNCIFINNTGIGAAISCWGSDNNIINCSFVNNTGAIQCFSDSNANIINCNFTGNTAEINGIVSRGGAIDGYGCTINIADCNFIRNSAYFGGAINVDYGTMKINKCIFIENTANTGGAIYYDSPFTSYVKNSKFSKNNATNSYDYAGSGAAIYSSRNTLIVSGCVYVIKDVPKIEINAENIDYGETLIVNVQLPSDVTRRPTATVNGESKPVSLKNGTGTVKFTGLNAGTYSIDVYYAGDAIYSNASANAEVIVNKAIPHIEVVANASANGGDLIVNVSLPSDATGQAVVSVGGEFVVVSLIDGVACANFIGLDVGTYVVEVFYEGDDNYLNATADTSVVVGKETPQIDVVADDIAYGEDLIVNVVLSGDATGQAVVSVGGESVVVALIDGVGCASFSGLGVGTYVVEVFYEGDDNYLNATADASVSVSKATPQIDIVAGTVAYGEDLVVNVVLPNDVSRRPTVTVDGESKVVTLKNGTGSVKFNDLSIGTYTIGVSYSGDSNYLKASANATAKVTKATPEIKVIANDISYGDDLVVDVQLPYDVSRRPTVTVDNQSKAVSLKDGVGTVKFSGLTVGTHTIEVTYNGDANYLKSAVNKTVKVTRGTPEIKVTSEDNNGELTINVQMPSDVTRRVSVTINDVTKTISLKNGTGSVKFTGLTPGIYSAQVSYAGDTNYLKASVNKTVKVNRYAPKITVTAKSVQYGNDLVVEVKLPADVTRRVTVTLGNQTKTVSLKDGQTTVKFSGLAVGTYDLDVSYAGDTNYLKASVNKTVKVTKAVPDIEITANDISVGETLNVGVKLPADVTRRATVTVGGQTKTVTLKNGTANVKFTGLEAGNHQVKVTYAGDTNYKASETSTTVNVK